MAHRSRARLRTAAIGWPLVHEFAGRLGGVRSPDFLRGGDRIGLHRTLRSQVVSHFAQAPGHSARVLLRPGVDYPVFSDDGRCLECVASWQWLVGSLARHHHISDSARFRCSMAGNFLWSASAPLGPGRDRSALGCSSGHCNLILENLCAVGRTSYSLPRMDQLCDILERRNLSFELIASAIAIRQ